MNGRGSFPSFETPVGTARSKSYQKDSPAFTEIVSLVIASEDRRRRGWTRPSTRFSTSPRSFPLRQKSFWRRRVFRRISICRFRILRAGVGHRTPAAPNRPKAVSSTATRKISPSPIFAISWISSAADFSADSIRPAASSKLTSEVSDARDADLAVPTMEIPRCPHGRRNLSG